MEEFDAIEKNTEEINTFYLYKPSIPDDYSEEEKQLQREFGVLKQLKKTLLELKTKMQKEKQKEEEKTKAPQSTSKAKEQAAKLLKSGVIKINNKNKNTFKRKTKESEQSTNLSDDEDIRANTPNVASPAPASKKPRHITDNFVTSKQSIHKLSRDKGDDFELNVSGNREDENASNNSDGINYSDEGGASGRKRKQQLVYLNENKTKKTSAAPFHSDDTSDDEDVELPNKDNNRPATSTNMQDVLTPQAGGVSSESRVSTAGGKTLCVLSYKLDEDILTKLFSEYGRIECMNIVKSDRQKHYRAKAFVTLDSMKSAEAAVDALNGKYHLSRCWTVAYARKQQRNFYSKSDRSCETWGARASNRDNSASPEKIPRRESESNQDEDNSKPVDNPVYSEIARNLVSYEDF